LHASTSPKLVWGCSTMAEALRIERRVGANIALDRPVFVGPDPSGPWTPRHSSHTIRAGNSSPRLLGVKHARFGWIGQTGRDSNR
jgi:hypothetical protein